MPRPISECQKVVNVFKNKAFGSMNKVDEMTYNEIADRLENAAKKIKLIKSEKSKARRLAHDRREDYSNHTPRE